MSAAVAAGAFLLLAVLERLFPLRPRTEAQGPHLARNLVLAGTAAATATALQAVLLRPVADLVARHHLGLVPRLGLPPAAALVLSVLLLDYTLWHWHRWNHHVGWLWRFHLVHHVDRDLDASTALRFHFGEMALSVPYRAAQVALIGADAAALSLWTALLLVSILFHHSNLRLPARVDALLVRLVVTPRMHGIHHSERRNEVHTNFASLLTIWDALHRTLRLDVPQETVVIGVPGYRQRRWLGLGALLALPFRRQVAYWPGPAQG
ncbi:MAG TPA: sterol desaturase family protein [Vicinamibacteria bacterium]|nr:sterol desaturase family protein [Vicinamibacteria bacterium]